MFDNKEFIAMQSSLQYLWMKQKAITHNLANYETPNYKAKSVSFEEVLSGASNSPQGGKFAYKAKVLTNDKTAARPDGNNVDVDAQSLELYQTYLQASYVTSKISGEIANVRYVIKQAFK